MMLKFLPQRWKELLSADLPGHWAHENMAPAYRIAYSHAGDPVKAAVLILVYPGPVRPYLVFMKRNTYDGPHSGQVSFPGGSSEPQDISLEATAIRETREELGIEGMIQLLGSLTSLHIPVSNYHVTPFVGWMDARPRFNPDHSEVEYLVEVPLEALMDPLNRMSGPVTRHGEYINAPYYRAGKERIWGATAMILSEFLQLTAMMP